MNDVNSELRRFRNTNAQLVSNHRKLWQYLPEHAQLTLYYEEKHEMYCDFTMGKKIGDAYYAAKNLNFKKPLYFAAFLVLWRVDVEKKKDPLKEQMVIRIQRILDGVTLTESECKQITFCAAILRSAVKEKLAIEKENGGKKSFLYATPFVSFALNRLENELQKSVFRFATGCDVPHYSFAKFTAALILESIKEKELNNEQKRQEP